MKISLGFIMVVVLGILLPAQGFAQDEKGIKVKREHLKLLREGVLLVRLPNIDKKLAALEAAGQHQRAKEEKKENQKLQEVVIEMFGRYYDYSKVYFFDSSNSSLVQERKFEHILFDKEGNEVVVDTTTDIYIADIGYGNPAGRTERYNREGVQVKYLDNGTIQPLANDVFYSGANNIFTNTKKTYTKAIYKLNLNLYGGYKFKTIN